jgi:hypothetical protein
MSVIENYFEDESLDSNSDDSGDDDDDMDDDDDLVQPGDEMYKRYFGDRSWKGNQIENSAVSGKALASALSETRPRPSLGLSTDMLAPIVAVIPPGLDVMNGQSVALAMRWKLGTWDQEDDKNENELKDDSTRKSRSLAKLHLPHYRDLVPVSPTRDGAFTRTRSDPNLSKAESQRKSRFDRPKDEPGVHGGHYTVRPNIEESMTFLNKLYSHQKDAGSTFPTLVTPPDSPVRKFKISLHLLQPFIVWVY